MQLTLHVLNSVNFPEKTSVFQARGLAVKHSVNKQGYSEITRSNSQQV
jgi:hypothetical protein